MRPALLATLAVALWGCATPAPAQAPTWRTTQFEDGSGWVQRGGVRCELPALDDTPRQVRRHRCH